MVMLFGEAFRYVEAKARLCLAYSNNNMESGSFPFSYDKARRFAEQWSSIIYTL
jgi:hypothetical protein